MVSVLKVLMQTSIVVLRQRGLSQRRIAKLLGLDRGTVTRYVRLHAAVSFGYPRSSRGNQS